MGPGSRCSDGDCTASFEQACCLTGETCLDLVPEDCASMGGTLQGQESECARSGCDTDRPGAVPNGTAARPGLPLTIRRGTGDELVMTWSSSCSSEALAHAIHEGTLGHWYSHHSTCADITTELTTTHSPETGDRYFLVVPITGWDEGSGGLHSSGEERPPAATTCILRRRLGCP